MTITYTLEVSQARLFGFAKVLLRWRGSLHQIIYRELTIFMLLFYAIAAIYRGLMGEEQKRVFEHLATYCRELTEQLPLTFLLGFYVSLVVARWWQQYMSIPWPDRVAVKLAAFMHGSDDRARMIRRTLVRYLNLMYCLVFQTSSTVIKKRFPTLKHVYEAGLLTKEELTELETCNSSYGNWWIPCCWFTSLISDCRTDGLLDDDHSFDAIVEEVSQFRSQCGMVASYDWISVPLVYTQVVTIATYSFFTSCLLGRQWLYKTPPGHKESSIVDCYVPLFTLFEFIFFVGWLKVAEAMMCPFGEDDDDFELNYILDRNVQVGFQIVDEFCDKSPPLSRDIFWEQPDASMPYTRAVMRRQSAAFIGSTASLNISPEEATWRQPRNQTGGLTRQDAYIPPSPTRSPWYRMSKLVRSASEVLHRSPSASTIDHTTERRPRQKNSFSVSTNLGKLGFSRQSSMRSKRASADTTLYNLWLTPYPMDNAPVFTVETETQDKTKLDMPVLREEPIREVLAEISNYLEQNHETNSFPNYRTTE